MNLKWPALGGGSLLATGAIYLAIPIMLGLGSPSACGCAARVSDNSRVWGACAIRTAVKMREEAKFAFIFERGITRDGPTPWPSQNEAYETFLSGPITGSCGSFEKARNEDLRQAELRDYWGYESLYVPEKSSDAIAYANSEAGKNGLYLEEVIKEMRGTDA